MTSHTDIQIAKATAAQYVRETAKAQVAYDREIKFFEEHSFHRLAFPAVRDRLEYCKAKAMEWAAEVERLEQAYHAEVTADME